MIVSILIKCAIYYSFVLLAYEIYLFIRAIKSKKGFAFGYDYKALVIPIALILAALAKHYIK